MAEDKGVPVVQLDCSGGGAISAGGVARPREDGGLGEGADGARARESVSEDASLFLSLSLSLVSVRWFVWNLSSTLSSVLLVRQMSLRPRGMNAVRHQHHHAPSPPISPHEDCEPPAPRTSSSSSSLPPPCSSEDSLRHTHTPPAVSLTSLAHLGIAPLSLSAAAAVVCLVTSGPQSEKSSGRVQRSVRTSSSSS